MTIGTPVFHAWRDHTRANRTRKRALLRTIFQRLSCHTLFRALNQWRHFTSREVHASFRARLTAQHLLLGHQLVEQKKARYRAMVRRWTPKPREEVFRAWRTRAREQRSRKHQLLRRCVDRLASTEITRAWHRWCVFTQRTRLLGVQDQLTAQVSSLRRQQVETMALQRRSRVLAPMFSGWTALTRERRTRKVYVLDRVVRLIGQTSKSVAFHRWALFTSNTATADLKERFAQQQADLLDEVARQKQRRIRDLVHKWRMAALTPFMLAWRTQVWETKAKKRQLLERCLSRLAHQHVHRAFRVWTNHVEATQVAALRARIQAEKLGRYNLMVRAWSRRTLTPAFLAWRTTAKANARRKKQLLRRVFARHSERSLATALRTWKDAAVRAAAAEAVRTRETEAAALLKQHEVETARLTAQHERQALALRSECDAQIVALESDLVAQTTSLQRELDEQTSALRMHLHAETTSLRLQLNQSRSSRLRATLTHWSHHLQSTPFRAWRAYAQDTRRARTTVEERRREAVEGLLRRMALHGKLRAMRQWRHFVKRERAEEGRTHQANEQQHLRESRASAAGRILTRLLIQSQRSVFRNWRHLSRTLRSDRFHTLSTRDSTLSRAVQHRERANAWTAWRTWLAHTRVHREAEIDRENQELRDFAVAAREERDAIQRKLDEQLEITTYLYKVVANSV